MTSKIYAPEPGRRALFGGEIDINNSVAIIGAIGAARSGQRLGSAYLYDVNTNQWLGELEPADGPTVNRFGGAVATDGGLSLVSGVLDDGLGVSKSVVYVYETQSQTQVARWMPPDPLAYSSYGAELSLSGNYALVSAPQENYVLDHLYTGSAYVIDARTGQQLHRLRPSDPTQIDIFGSAVDTSGQVALIGAPALPNIHVETGAAFLFDMQTGQELYRLTAEDAEVGDGFGYSVALQGDYALVGAPHHKTDGVPTGAAYLFRVSTGEQMAKFTPGFNTDYDWFGVSVAIDGQYAAIASRYGNGSSYDEGSVYVFDILTSALLGKSSLNKRDFDSEYFGESMALENGRLFVGATGDDYRPVSGEDAGAVYVYRVIPEPTAAVLSWAGSLTMLFRSRKLRGSGSEARSAECAPA